MNHKILIHHVKDNVGVAIQDIKMGEKVIGHYLDGKKENIVEIEALTDIPLGHKVALKDISKGEVIIKYGEIIGEATMDIKKGQHVHVHNIKSRRW